MDKSAQKFIVRLTNGIALKFHSNLTCRKVFSAVLDNEATQFDGIWLAELKAKEHGLRDGTFEVEPVTQPAEVAS